MDVNVHLCDNALLHDYSVPDILLQVCKPKASLLFIYRKLYQLHPLNNCWGCPGKFFVGGKVCIMLGIRL